MKIVYIANIRIPTSKAHGLQVAKMSESFSANGAEVELVVPSRKNRELLGVNLFSYYGIKKNFTFKKIWCLDPLFLIGFKNGIYIKIQSLLFSVSLFFYLAFKNKTSSDVGYVRDEYLLPIVLRFFPNVVWEAHNLPNHRQYYVKYFKRCQKIVTITSGLKQDLITLGVSADNIYVAPDGVDLDQFAVKEDKNYCRKQLNLVKDQKLIIYTGQLFEWKGVFTLADCGQYLTGATIIFVGGTATDQTILKKYIEGKKIINTVLINQQPHDKIPYFLKAADVLVLPNSGKKEISAKYTSPLKLFEYMTSGNPIVASDLPSIREVLDESNSILVKPDSALNLAAGIKKVLFDRVLADQISQRCLEQVKMYSWDKRAASIIKELKSNH
ncbi:MAG: glycosyltransferase [Patescibacteria group bacterium]|nr:glycosyltransferase [Patescibacteria group bacterium]